MPENRAPVTGHDGAGLSFDPGGAQRDGRGKAAQCEEDRARQGRNDAAAHGLATEQVAGIDQLHRAQEHQVKCWRHKCGAAPPRQAAAQRVGCATERPAHPAGHATHHGQVDQRHDQACGQHEDQGDRQHAHEFTRNTGPEQHRQERAERRCGGADDRPEHALGGLDIGRHGPRSFLDALVGIFDHDDGTIHQHAHGQDQAEHHDVRDGHPHHRQQNEAKKEGCGDRKAHQQRRARPKAGQHHYHHQRDGGQHRAFQLADH